MHRVPRRGCVKHQPTDVLLNQKSGSPLDTDLERISLGSPRIKDLRDLFVIESGARSRSRTLSVLTACEYRGCLTQQRVWLPSPRVFWRAPAVTPFNIILVSLNEAVRQSGAVPRPTPVPSDLSAHRRGGSLQPCRDCSNGQALDESAGDLLAIGQR